MKQLLKYFAYLTLFVSLILGQSKNHIGFDSTYINLFDDLKVILISDSLALVSELIVQRFDSTANLYSNYYRTLYSYNSNGQQTEYLSQGWKNSAWEDSFRMENSYNTQGLLSVSLYQFYAMGWQNSSKTERFYNAYNNLTQIVDYYWYNSAWVPNYKNEFLYDSQQRLVEQVGSSYNQWQVPPDWVYTYKLTNQYNSLSQVELDYVYYYDGTNWNPSIRTSYTYTPSGKSETSYTEEYDSSWVPSSSDSSAYNMNDQLTYNLYKRFDGTTWQNIEQMENFYQNNLITESVQTSWMYDPYEMWKYRDLFSYSADNLVSQTSQSWENNQWVNQSLMNMAYNSQNNVTVMEMFMWNGTSWDPNYKYIYAYTNVLDVAEEPLVKDVVLYQNYPNPFNSSTKIVYYLPAPTEVTLILYNTLGEKIKTLDEGMKLAGNHEVILDDNTLSSGVYFYEFSTQNKAFSKKMILLK